MSQRPRPRLKVAFVGFETLTALFASVRCDATHIRLPRLALPENATVVSVFDDQPRRAFGVLISSPDFPEVEPACVPPVIDLQFESERIPKLEPLKARIDGLFNRAFGERDEPLCAALRSIRELL